MTHLQIPKGWLNADLFDIIQTLENGSRPKGGVKNIQEGIPSLGGEHLTYDGKFNFSSIKYIPREFFKKMTKGKVKKNDILIVKDGATTGKTSYVDESFPYPYAAVNEHVFIMRPKDILLPKFLYYYIINSQSQSLIKQRTRGDIGGINTTFVRNFPIFFPKDKKIQQKIVQKLDYILGQLEEKKKKVLEVTKLNQERLNNLKISYLPYIIEKIIPFDNLPNGWKLKNLENLSKRITDGEHFKPTTIVDGIPFLSAKDVRDDEPKFDDCYFISEKDYEKFKKRCNPEKNDILLVSRGATIGRTCINNSDTKFSLLGSVILIKLKPEIKSQYVLFCLKSKMIQKTLLSLSGSSAQQAIYLKHLKTVNIPFPENSMIQSEIVNQITDAQKNVDITISKLESVINHQERLLSMLNGLNQSVLNMAFSGKLVN